MDLRRELSRIKLRQAALRETISVMTQIGVDDRNIALKAELGTEILACSDEIRALFMRVQGAGIHPLTELVPLIKDLEELSTNIRKTDQEDWASNRAPDFWRCVSLMSVWVGRFEATILNSHYEVGVLVEAALEDLRARLATESSYRKDWQDAYDKREDDLEKLGGALFRQRDIWAFKAGDKNKITDLVLNEGSIDPSNLHPNIRGNILTEWKVIKKRPLETVANRLAKRFESKTGKDAQKFHIEANLLTHRDFCQVTSITSESEDWHKRLKELAIKCIEAADIQSNIYQEQVLHNAPTEKVHYLFIVSPDSIYLPPHKGKLFKGDNVEVRIRIIDVSEKPLTASQQSDLSPKITVPELKEALGI